MDRKPLESLDDILTALCDVVDDPHFGEILENSKFGMQDAWQFLKGNFNFHDDTFIYEGLKQINKSTPNKIKNLSEALDRRGNIEEISDFRQRSLGYKVLTTPLWLPKKAASWALNKFSNDGVRSGVHYATLLAETIGFSYLTAMVEPGLVPAVYTWSVMSEVGDKTLDHQATSQIMGSLWSLQLNHKHHKLLSTCSAKKIEFGKLITVSDEFISDYKNQRIRSDNFEELLEINPEFGDFLDSIHKEGHCYKYLAAAAAGFLPISDLPDKGKSIRDSVLSFFNTKKNNPVDGDHIVGALLRKVQEDLISTAKTGDNVPLEFNTKELDTLSHYTPIFKMKLASCSDSETPKQYLEGTITIPLNEIKGQVRIDKLISGLESSISQYIQNGNLVPDPTLENCPKIVERVGLDLSKISQMKINVNEFINVSNSTSIDKDNIIITYGVHSSLGNSRRRLEREAIEKETRFENLFYILGGNIISTGYKTIERWALSEQNEDSERWQKEHASGRIDLSYIQEYIISKARENFERQVMSLYEQKTLKLESIVKENNNPDNLFSLGVHKLIKNRVEGSIYINQAIENGLLEQDNPSGLLDQVKGISTVKNRNPLYTITKRIKK